MSNPNLPGLDILGCYRIAGDVMFVRERNKGHEVEFDLVRFRIGGHLVCSGVYDGRSIQSQLSSLYEQGKKVLDKYEKMSRYREART